MLFEVSGRLESPSSILTYLQCPRKYYYHYIKKLGQKPSIHLVVGGVVHSAIQAFHNTDVNELGQGDVFEAFHARLIENFSRKWAESEGELNSLGLSNEEVRDYYDQARFMLDNFFRHHISKVIACQHRNKLTINGAWFRLRPKTETKIISDRLGLMGVIDAIHVFDGEDVILDYKTSKKSEINDEHLIQLSLYALLYRDFFGRLPGRVGIHFLRHGEKLLPVKPELLALGESTCQKIHDAVKSEDLADYPPRPSGLCKFRTGECDYYEICKVIVPNRN